MAITPDWSTCPSPSSVVDGDLSADAVDSSSDITGVLRVRNLLVMLDARSVYVGSQELRVGGRVFDLLVILLRHRGRIVTKAEIFDYVWPSTNVEESNLRFQMALLRKALGQHRDLIRTVPGRGYFFVGNDANECVTDGECTGNNRDLIRPERLSYKELVRENNQLRLALSNILLERISICFQLTKAPENEDLPTLSNLRQSSRYASFEATR